MLEPVARSLDLVEAARTLAASLERVPAPLLVVDVPAGLIRAMNAKARDLLGHGPDALPMSAAGWKRIFLGNAMDVDMDATGRVLISPELREAAGISKDTMLLGMGNHFELWDKATYDEQEAKAMQGEMPDVFKDFSF